MLFEANGAVYWRFYERKRRRENNVGSIKRYYMEVPDLHVQYGHSDVFRGKTIPCS